MNNNNFSVEQYPIVVQVLRINGQNYAQAYQPDFDYRVIELHQPKLQSQMASLIFRVHSELKIKMEMLRIHGKPLPIPAKPKGSFDLDNHFELSTAQAARLLKVSNMTVVRLADDGTLPCLKTPKGHRRFKRSDVEKLDPKEKPTPTLPPIIVPFPHETKASPTPLATDPSQKLNIFSAQFNESLIEV